MCCFSNLCRIPLSGLQRAGNLNGKFIQIGDTDPDDESKPQSHSLILSCMVSMGFQMALVVKNPPAWVAKIPCRQPECSSVQECFYKFHCPDDLATLKMSVTYVEEVSIQARAGLAARSSHVPSRAKPKLRQLPEIATTSLSAPSLSPAS